MSCLQEFCVAPSLWGSPGSYSICVFSHPGGSLFTVGGRSGHSWRAWEGLEEALSRRGPPWPPCSQAVLVSSSEAQRCLLLVKSSPCWDQRLPRHTRAWGSPSRSPLRPWQAQLPAPAWDLPEALAVFGVYLPAGPSCAGAAPEGSVLAPLDDLGLDRSHVRFLRCPSVSWPVHRPLLSVL